MVFKNNSKSQKMTCSLLILASLINGCASNEKRVPEDSNQAINWPFLGQTGQPDLRDPKVEARWIEDRIIGNRFIEGHYEYLITEPAHWDKKQ